jgi:hypothetical protein
VTKCGELLQTLKHVGNSLIIVCSLGGKKLGRSKSGKSSKPAFHSKRRKTWDSCVHVASPHWQSKISFFDGSNQKEWVYENP